MSPKSIPVLILAALLAAQAAAQPAPAPAPAPQQEFQALLERVKKSDASVDFARMRQLQTQIDSYEPYGLDVEESPLAVLADGLQVAGQGLLSDDAGHSYDLLTGVNPETKATQEVYFNIDAMMGALDRELSP